MGRPPGARSGDWRRGYPQDWELREPINASRRLAERVEELGESDEDDGQGVILDPMNPAARQRAFVGDKLHFDGYDLGQNRTTRDRRGVYDDAYDDYYYSDEEYRDSRARQQGRPRDDALVQSALDRIAHARVNGQTNVNLTREEMEALERRGSQQPEPAPSTALVSPPATPAKSKVKSSSRASSTSSMPGQKARKRSNSSFFSSPAKSNSKAKVTRKPSGEQGPPPPPPGAPGIMVPGPNGVPVFAPIGYYAPPSPDFQRSPSGGSRSSSKHSRRESTPPEQLYPPPRNYRPGSQGSLRSQEDMDWYPPPPTSRHRSASNAHYDYDMAPPGPAAPQGRRHASGPPDVRYASLRRAPPSSSPLAPRASPANVGASGLRRTETNSSSSSEDQGVQIEILPDENGGYSIRSAPAVTAAPVPAPSTPPANSGKEARKRRTGRR